MESLSYMMKRLRNILENMKNRQPCTCTIDTCTGIRECVFIMLGHHLAVAGENKRLWKSAVE